MTTVTSDVPAHLVVDFDLFDERDIESVTQRLDELQRTTPLAYSPTSGGFWFVTRYDDVHEVMRNDTVFSAAETGLMMGASPPRLPPLHFDPPEHTDYRALLNPVFSPARMKAVEDDVRRTARQLVGGFARRGSCEFISEFAHPLPTTTFLALMGWPEEDVTLLARWAETLIVGPAGASEAELAQERAATQELVRQYFTEMVEQRRRDPDVDDVTGHLLRARYAGERPLDDDELIRILSLLMVAGLHTVRGVMAFGMIHLSEAPDQRRLLVEDPSLIPRAVEELLRLGVGTAPARVVTKPVTMHGVELQPGDHVVGFLSAANRDPAEFACPHAVEVNRTPNRHLAFAPGRHRCLGSNLARVELTIALGELLARIPDFTVDPTRPPRFHHSQIRGVRELHLRFTPEA